MFLASQTLISSRAPADRSLYFKGKNKVSDQFTEPSSYTDAAVLVAVVRGSSAADGNKDEGGKAIDNLFESCSNKNKREKVGAANKHKNSAPTFCEELE